MIIHINRLNGTPRYAHAEGYTNLCFSEDGEYIITCGSDGDVRMYKGIEDDDVPAKCVGEKAFAVVQKNDKLYVGSDHNYVQILTFPDGELDGILTRFTAPVNTIDVSKDGSLVAAGSSDAEIQVIDVATSGVKYFSSHKAPILNVSIDPKNEYLASSSCDGTVRVWRIADQKIVKEWTGVNNTCNSFHNSETLCNLSWEPLTGRLLAIPFSNEIKLMQRSTWNEMVHFSGSASSKYSLTSWSNCGRFLAATTSCGEVYVWNTLVNELVSSFCDGSKINICALRWHPKSDMGQMAYCDVKGQLAMFENCYPMTQLNSKENKLENNETELNVDCDKYAGNVSEDEDDPEAISIEKIKSAYNSFTELKDDDDDDDDGSVRSVSVNCTKPVFQTDFQTAFQPTSTPVHLQRRFMVFNDVGYVRQINTEEENIIDVDFHDASIHHAFRINNLLNHSMAALNSEGLILASEKSEDCASRLACRIFKSWDSSKEWTTEVPLNENIEAIAVGLRWLAVATSQRLLRLFSISGVQREIICLPGPVVCMNGSEDLLIIVYHYSMGLPGQQNLSFLVYQITFDIKVLIAAQPLPLVTKTTLKWVGFSDQFNPCFLDSNGTVNLFSSSSGLWKPICFIDADKKNCPNYHFVVGVSEERQSIRCILCKSSFYPATTPHPFITEVAWRVPVCDISVDKGSLEEKFWRCSLAKECLGKEDKKLNKEFLATALKLFALSCQTNHEMRVYELCDIANQLDVTELALKYASKINNIVLVNKLSELQLEQKERSETVLNIPKPDRGISSYEEDRQKKGSFNEYESQELFTEKSCINSQSNSARDVDEQYSFLDTGSVQQSTDEVSLIAEIKKKKSSSEQRTTFLPSRKINPFKKSNSNDTRNDSFEGLQSNGSLDQTIDYKQENLELPFAEWFRREKSNLVQEFTEVADLDLAKVAIKKYKSLKISSENSTESNENIRTENERNSSESEFQNANKKRKLMVSSTTADEKKKTGIEKRDSLFKLQKFKSTKA